LILAKIRAVSAIVYPDFILRSVLFGEIFNFEAQASWFSRFEPCNFILSFTNPSADHCFFGLNAPFLPNRALNSLAAMVDTRDRCPFRAFFGVVVTKKVCNCHLRDKRFF